MTELVYGRRAMKLPTPSNLVFWCRCYTIISGALIIALKTAPFIHTDSVLQQSIEWILTTTTTLANLLLPMAGLKTSDKQVPIDQVTALEPPKKDN